jgi:hypothetical protein
MHTKGNWEGELRTGVIKSGETWIAACTNHKSSYRNGLFEPCDEDKANIMLVAAAPDLLEACEKGRAELEAMHSLYLGKCSGGCPTIEIIKLMDEAIEKAEVS